MGSEFNGGVNGGKIREDAPGGCAEAFAEVRVALAQCDGRQGGQQSSWPLNISFIHKLPFLE